VAVFNPETSVGTFCASLDEIFQDGRKLNNEKQSMEMGIDTKYRK